MTELTAEAVAYRARALAQAHPLTKLARHYLDWAVAGQRTSQPLPEIGIWAGAAILEGYCVRRVEEEDLNLDGGSAAAQAAQAASAASTASAASGGDGPAEDAVSMSLEELDEATVRIAADLRTGSTEAEPSQWGHQDPALDRRLILALDRIVASQVSNRLEHWRDSVDDYAWRELEEYITWWVVKGYALRVAETNREALRR
jgi:hypothetical protein